MTITPESANSVFSAGHPIRYSVRIMNAGSQSSNDLLEYTIIGSDGGVAGRGRRPVFLAAGQSWSASVLLPRPPRFDLYTLSTKLIHDAFGHATLLSMATETWALVPAPKPGAGHRFGLNANLAPVVSNPQGLAVGMTTMRAEGLGWYRLEFNALRIATSSSDENWSAIDTLVKSAHQTHLKVLGLLTAWPGGDNPFVVHAKLSFAQAVSRYAQFAEAAVSRYMPGGLLAQSQGWAHYGITAWELWNEPTTAAYWQGTPAQYAQLVQAAAQAIRKIDPSATGLAYTDAPKTLLTADSPPAFTALAWHYYPGASSPDSPVASVYSAIAPIVAAESTTLPPVESLPLWLTETGWSTQWVTPHQQAAYWVRAALDALAEGTHKVFFFTESYPGSGYGELTGQSEPKITVPAVAALTQNLAGYQPAGSIELGSAVRGWLWQNGTNAMATLWNLGQTPGQLTVFSLNGAITAVNWMDNPVVSASYQPPNPHHGHYPSLRNRSWAISPGPCPGLAKWPAIRHSANIGSLFALADAQRVNRLAAGTHRHQSKQYANFRHTCRELAGRLVGGYLRQHIWPPGFRNQRHSYHPHYPHCHGPVERLSGHHCCDNDQWHFAVAHRNPVHFS